MADSILEQIAVWHLAAINGVTVANGYQNTLTATRAGEQLIAGEPIEDLTTLCALAADEDAVQKVDETLDTIDPTTTWSQRFDAYVHLLGQAGTGVTEDERITRIVADVHKRIGMELAAQRATDGPYCSSLADAIELLPWEIGVSVVYNCTVVNVPVRITYTVLTNDPYSQP